MKILQMSAVLWCAVAMVYAQSSNKNLAVSNFVLSDEQVMRIIENGETAIIDHVAAQRVFPYACDYVYNDKIIFQVPDDMEHISYRAIYIWRPLKGQLQDANVPQMLFFIGGIDFEKKGKMKIFQMQNMVFTSKYP